MGLAIDGKKINGLAFAGQLFKQEINSGELDFSETGKKINSIKNFIILNAPDQMNSFKSDYENTEKSTIIKLGEFDPVNSNNDRTIFLLCTVKQPKRKIAFVLVNIISTWKAMFDYGDFTQRYPILLICEYKDITFGGGS